MGILELIIGIILFILILNLLFAVVPIPRGIGGALVVIVLIILVWIIVF